MLLTEGTVRRRERSFAILHLRGLATNASDLRTCPIFRAVDHTTLADPTVPLYLGTASK